MGSQICLGWKGPQRSPRSNPLPGAGCLPADRAAQSPSELSLNTARDGACTTPPDTSFPCSPRWERRISCHVPLEPGRFPGKAAGRGGSAGRQRHLPVALRAWGERAEPAGARPSLGNMSVLSLGSVPVLPWKMCTSFPGECALPSLRNEPVLPWEMCPSFPGECPCPSLGHVPVLSWGMSPSFPGEAECPHPFLGTRQPRDGVLQGMPAAPGRWIMETKPRSLWPPRADGWEQLGWTGREVRIALVYELRVPLTNRV